jgi:predicted acyl esterase
MRRTASLLVGCLLAAPAVVAQQLEMPKGVPDEAMPVLAARALGAYAAPDDDRFRLQLVASRYAEAAKTLAAMPAAAANVRWEIYAKAKSIDGKPFDEAFAQALRETMRALDDNTAYRVLWSFGTKVSVLQRAFDEALARQKNAETVPLADAVDLVKKYLSAKAYASFAPLLPALADEDDRRRYVIEKNVPVKTPDGATVCTIVVRPRERKLPALLNFTIYADPETTYNEARRTASYGFAGVVGLTRGKDCSPGAPVPYEHDGADAAALVDWIAAQPWSDGRVGMYGGSYEGSTPWAAAKHRPKALKAIMDGAPVAPGTDVPMEGNVFWNFVYPWPFYTTNNKTLDNATYMDGARWQRLDHDWYASGRAYRDREKIDGTPNPIFNRWIAHPSYDAYWQAMIPYGKEFARIDIPVLTTAGYYFGGPGAAVYYVEQHTRHRPHAEHYLVIGPWDHVRGHSGTISPVGTKTMTSLAGYELEPSAHLDMAELRYRWFDYVFQRGPKPAILADKINYMVVGANTWKHVPSLAAMANHRLRIPFKETTLTVNLADRSDVDRDVPGGNVIDKAIDTANAVTFTSAPIEKATEASGLFSGHLDFIANKKDFDYNVVLYEQMKSGEYVLLAPYWARASYNGHLGVRRLLTPGKRQRLDFEAVRLMGRQLQPGSRIVVVLSVIKETGRQINYGTGKDVSDETTADAKEPLTIRWLAASYVDLPLRR